MRISLYVDFSDITSAKETLVDKLNSLIVVDPKHQMYKTEPLAHILKSLKEAGLDGIELIVPKILTDKNIREIKDIVREHEIPILSIHQADNDLFSISLPEIERLCKIAKVFSARVIVLHINVLGKRLSEQAFLTKLKNLQKQYNITFGIENVAKSPFTLAKELYRGNEFGQTIKLSDLTITFDTTHLGQANDDICEFYKKNKEKIVNIHLSDYKKSWLNRAIFLANGTHLPLMEGELPIVKFLKTLKEENYQGLITMEINAGLNKLCQNAEIIKNAFK